MPTRMLMPIYYARREAPQPSELKRGACVRLWAHSWGRYSTRTAPVLRPEEATADHRSAHRLLSGHGSCRFHDLGLSKSFSRRAMVGICGGLRAGRFVSLFRSALGSF